MNATQCSRRIALAAVVLLSLGAAAEGLLDKLLRISGLSLAPGELRGPDGEPGSLWMVRLEGGGPQRLTPDGGYRTPVFAATDESVFALKDDAVVRVSSTGSAPTVVHKVDGVQKLIGFDRRSPDEIVVLMDDGAVRWRSCR